jgi:putative membrane protein
LNQHVFSAIRQWFDPRRIDEVGATPDYRFSLANERTFLAWIRTGLALIAGGLGVAAFVPSHKWGYVREVMAIVLILLGASVAIRAVDHWARSERAIRLGQPLPRSRFPALLALAVAVGAALIVVLILVTGQP